MNRWVLVSLLLLTQPVYAAGPWLLVKADSAGATIMDVEEYRAHHFAESTPPLLRSGLQADSVTVAAIVRITDRDVRENALHMMGNDEWLVIIDLIGVLEPGYLAFTNVAEEGFPCPRTIFSGAVLDGSAWSACEKTGLLAHEWRHARDFIDLRAPAYFATQLETTSFDQDLDLLEYEYRGFLEQLTALKVGGCLEENPFGRAYQHGGVRELRRMIAEVYGLFQKHPNRRQTLDLACRWPPWIENITAP